MLSKFACNAVLNEGAANRFISKLRSNPICNKGEHFPTSMRHVFAKTAIVGATSITFFRISEIKIPNSREDQAIIKQSCLE
jgi:hypothetical protein